MAWIFAGVLVGVMLIAVAQGRDPKKAMNEYFAGLFGCLVILIGLVVLVYFLFLRKPEDQIAAGTTQVQSGNYGAAIDAFTKAIEKNPNDASAYDGRGVARRLKGDVEGAIKDHSQAIALSPNDATAFNNRGVAKSEKGDVDEAILDYSSALRIDPNKLSALANRGIAREGKGDTKGALEDYTKALGLAPLSWPELAAVQRRHDNLQSKRSE